jgi:hypothetical protein
MNIAEYEKVKSVVSTVRQFKKFKRAVSAANTILATDLEPATKINGDFKLPFDSCFVKMEKHYSSLLFYTSDGMGFITYHDNHGPVVITAGLITKAEVTDDGTIGMDLDVQVSYQDVWIGKTKTKKKVTKQRNTVKTFFHGQRMIKNDKIISDNSKLIIRKALRKLENK